MTHRAPPWDWIARAVPAGVLATMTMDAAMLGVARLGGGAFSSPRLGIDVIGRWGLGLCRGRVRRDGAGLDAPRTLDVAAGLVTHYATGVALTAAFALSPWRPGGHRRAAVGYGLATAVLPLTVLFPALGYGFLGLRSGEAARLARIMLVGHLGFGVGIALGTAPVTVPPPAASVRASRLLHSSRPADNRRATATGEGRHSAGG